MAANTAPGASGGAGSSVPPPVSSRFDPDGQDRLVGLLERLRREPQLREWVLAAPTGALATLGIALDDHEIVNLLDEIEGMDERPLPVAAGDVMTREVITTTEDASVHEVAQTLSEHHISGLPVCSGDGKLVGIISEYDLIARTGVTVREVMSRDVVSVKENTPLHTVRAFIVGRRLKRVPVVDANGKLVGILSRADLIRELAYRWACKRCGEVARSRRAPAGCPRCGAADTFVAAPPLPAVAACPTCGRPLQDNAH